jgi:hypothetical protein
VRYLTICICVVYSFTILLPLPSAASEDNPCPKGDYTCEREPKKLALVIGNEGYKTLAPIPSSRPDAEMAAKILTDLGFVVDLHIDVKTLREFQYDILLEFAKKVAEGDFVVFYFSGHGFSHGPHNFLAPTEMPLSIKERDITRHAISVESVEDFFIGLSPGLTMFFIDACRSIPGFIVSDEQNRNVVGKGYSLPVNYNESANSMIAYATKPGKVASGSAAPGQLSIFTRALIEHLSAEGLPFSAVFDELSANVKVQTDSEQVPGLYDWSQTDPYLKPTSKNLDDVKEYWLATLQTGSYEKVQIFSLRYSVSRYSAAVRNWLADNRENYQARRFTLASPVAIERAWRPTNEDRVGVRRLALPFGFERSIEESKEESLQKMSDQEIGLVPSGTSRQKIAQLQTGEEYIISQGSPNMPRGKFYRDSLGFSLANIDAHGTVVTTQSFVARTEPSISAPLVEQIPSGTELKIDSITFGPDETIWVSALTPRHTSPFYIKIEPGTTPVPLELGQSIKEIIALPRPKSIPELVDPLSIDKALAELKAQGWKITWVSLATAQTDDERERDTRAAWIVSAEYILKRAGIDGRRITSVSGTRDFSGDGVRVRFFGVQ